jgi:hypothetical protein
MPKAQAEYEAAEEAARMVAFAGTMRTRGATRYDPDAPPLPPTTPRPSPYGDGKSCES